MERYPQILRSNCYMPAQNIFESAGSMFLNRSRIFGGLSTMWNIKPMLRVDYSRCACAASDVAGDVLPMTVDFS